MAQGNAMHLPLFRIKKLLLLCLFFKITVHLYEVLVELRKILKDIRTSMSL